MNANSSKGTKRPYGADRPFPWRCRHCGQMQVYMSVVSYDAEVRLEGRLHAFNIPKLETPVCQACKQRVITTRSDEQVSAAPRAHLNLLTPAEIRAGLERIGMSQKDAAELLGVAEEELGRWLDELQLLPKRSDILMRVLFQSPETVRRALHGNQDVSAPAAQTYVRTLILDP